VHVPDASDQASADGEVFGDPEAAERTGVHVIEQQGLLAGAELGEQVDVLGECAEAGNRRGEVVPTGVGVDGDVCLEIGGEQAPGSGEVARRPCVVVGTGDVECRLAGAKGAALAGFNQADKARQEVLPAGRYLLGGHAQVPEGQHASLGSFVAELELDCGGRPLRGAAVLQTGPLHTGWAGHLVHAHDDRLVHVLEAEGQLPTRPRRSGDDRCPPAAKTDNRGHGGEDTVPRRVTCHLVHKPSPPTPWVDSLISLLIPQPRTSLGLHKPNLEATADGTYAYLVSAQAALAALAEPRRRAMLLLVRDQPLSVGEIAEHFQITQQAVSQHLKILRDAGLVDVRAERQRRLYLVRPEGLQSVEAFLAELWPAGLQRLKTAVESGNAD